MKHAASPAGLPRSRAGFSLVEVMISLFIFTIIASMAAGVFVWCMRATKAGSSQINYITEARLAQEKVLKYIYMGNKLKGLSHTSTSLRIQMDYNADKAYEEAEIRYENRGAGKANKVLVYDPDRYNTYVTGGEVVICRYVSQIPGVPYFTVLTTGYDHGTARVAFRVGDGSTAADAADLAANSESGPGFQGVDVRISATPRDVQESIVKPAQ